MLLKFAPAITASHWVFCYDQLWKSKNQIDLVCSRYRETGRTEEKPYRLIEFLAEFKFTKGKNNLKRGLFHQWTALFLVHNQNRIRILSTPCLNYHSLRIRCRFSWHSSMNMEQALMIIHPLQTSISRKLYRSIQQ